MQSLKEGYKKEKILKQFTLAVQDQDWPLKKQAKRGRADAESEEADGAPASKAISFGLPAFSSEAPGQAKAGSGLLPVSSPAFGQGPFSFGAAPAKPAEADKDTKQPKADQGKAPAGSATALGASQAPSVPAFLAFGAKGAESAPGEQLSADARPFAPSFGAGGLLSFSAKEAPQNGDKDNPESAEAGSGVPLTEVCNTARWPIVAARAPACPDQQDEAVRLLWSWGRDAM